MDKISISPRRKRERERKTNEIVDAAEKVFFSVGFNKTTMETIAAELELTKPALYRYFKNKEDLYYAVVLRGTIILADMMDEEVALKNKGIDKISATGMAYCKFYKKHPDYSRLMLHTKNIQKSSECLNLEKLLEYNRNHLTIMSDAIDTGKLDGTIREDIDTLMTALYLVESTIAIMQLSENMEEPFKAMEMSNEDFIRHSFMLMRKSLENTVELGDLN